MYQPYCFKITLPTTDSLEVTAKIKGKYIATNRGGTLYFIASSQLEVGTQFPDALCIERWGLALEREEKRLDTK